jgi:hypothetical protein
VESLRPAAELSVRDHPRLRAGYAAQHGTDPRAIREDNFEYGLQRVLDGLETRLAGAA